MKLTKKQAYCLTELCKSSKSTWPVCQSAQSTGGFDRVRCEYEWADAPFRDLRKMGLIEKTGELHFGRAVHRITPEGRRVLNERKGQENE